MQSGFTVICINDNWELKQPAASTAVAPSFFDKDVVTYITETKEGQYFHLGNRFNPELGFIADNFAIADQVSEKDILAPDEICNHLIDMHTRHQIESDKRFKTTKKILWASAVVAFIGSVFLLKK